MCLCLCSHVSEVQPLSITHTYCVAQALRFESQQHATLCLHGLMQCCMDVVHCTTRVTHLLILACTSNLLRPIQDLVGENIVAKAVDTK